MNYDGVTGNLSLRNKKVTRNKINIIDVVKSAISENSDRKLFFSSFLDLVVASSEQKVVDSCCEPAEENHQNSKEHQTFKNINNRHKILKDEERLRHSIKQKLKIVRNLNSMLIFPIKFLPLLSLISSNPLLQKSPLQMILNIPSIMQNQRHRLPIHNFISQMLEHKTPGLDITQHTFLNIANFFYIILSYHINVRRLITL